MRNFAIVFGLALGLPWASTSQAELILYDNVQEWMAATKNVEVFRTYSENIGHANEVSSPPLGNSDLGSMLTFESANTGLSRSFVFASINIPPNMERGLVYDDSEAGLAGPRNISIGDADGTGNPKTRSMYENDDWRMGIFSGPRLTAFAFMLVGNDESIAESLNFYSGGVLIGSITDLASTESTRFIGVTTTEAITRIVFDEDEFDPGPDFDDIAVRDFRFGQKAEQPTAIAAESWAGIKSLFR